MNGLKQYVVKTGTGTTELHSGLTNDVGIYSELERFTKYWDRKFETVEYRLTVNYINITFD